LIQLLEKAESFALSSVKGEYSGQHASRLMLDDYTLTKTDEQYNEDYYYILEKL
jgi:hypothetical protein